MTLIAQYPAIFGVDVSAPLPLAALNEVGAAPVAPAQFPDSVTPLRETDRYRVAVAVFDMRIEEEYERWLALDSDDRDPADVATEHNALIHGEASNA